jgi:F420-dependent oxidoreductase-like protein
MRLGITAGYSGAQLAIDIDLITLAESVGFDSVWTSEAYGSDAFVPLAWIAAKTRRIRLGTGIAQMPARTPAMTAMTAMTLDALSGGRVILGIGPSGPQVVEGWHGVAYGKPLVRTREYVSIIRKILAREKPLEHEGEHYQIPYHGPDATGLGKPLKSILHGRADLPIYTASIGPAGVATSAELADGLIPVWMNPERFDLFEEPLAKGFAKSPGKGLATFDLAPMVSVVMGDDVDACRMPIRAMLALYIGGMGAKGKNFYTDYAKRLGYEEAADRVQDLFLAGKKGEAMAAIPDRFIDEVALVGPAERIRDRLAAWKASAVTTMIIGTVQPEAVRLLAEACL